MIPRISLWTPEVDIPIRLAVQGFDEQHLKEQATQIQDQSRAQMLTISPAAMYILSHIAGRRLVEPIRWVLLDSLREILVGNLRTEYAERQDLLASTFGEILGVLLLALRLGGQVEIVRLLESEEKTPDFLLLQQTSQATTIGHLLECKGFVEDVHNVNRRQSIDICQRIRDFRKDGQEQLEGARPGNLKYGARVVVDSGMDRSPLARAAASLNLTVVCVPDARIPRFVDPQVTFPSEERCKGRGCTCIDCMTSPVHSQHTNVIGTLHCKEKGFARPLGPALQDFVAQYCRAQRALWAEDDERFTEEMNNLLALPFADYPGLLPFATTLIQAAAQLPLDLREMRIDQFESLLDTGGTETRRRIQQAAATVARNREQERPRLEYVSDDEISERAKSGEMPRWTKSLLRAAIRQRYRVGGAVDWQGDTAVIHAFMDHTSPEAVDALMKFVDDLIQKLRGDFPRNDWKLATVAFGMNQLNLGFSWDQYPYANPSEEKKLPGITAWISREGRAEIIIRTRPPS